MKTLEAHLKTKFIFPLSLKFGMILGSIFLFLFFFFSTFSSKVTPKLIHIAELNINKYVEQTASDFKLFTLEKNSSDGFLKVMENKNGEIVSIDYDMKKIYQLAENLTTSLKENISNSRKFNPYTSVNNSFETPEDGLLLFFPIGVASNSIFLANLGPKIPVLVRFIGSVFSNVKTRVTDYGINNVLIDVYLQIAISYEVLTPVTMEEKQIQYELLLDSKVIQGKVPELYGGLWESQSAFFDVSFP